MTRIIRLAAWSLAILAIGGVSANTDSGKAEEIIRPGDLLRLEVVQDKDLTLRHDLRVSRFGSIPCYLEAWVPVSGLTLAQAQTYLKNKVFKGRMLHPQVSLRFLERGPRPMIVRAASRRTRLTSRTP